MSTSKHIDKICIIILILALIGTALFMNGKALGLEVLATEDNSSAYFTGSDLTQTPDTEDATLITLSDNGTVIEGNGAYMNGNSLTIALSGTYVITGSLSDGNIVVNGDGNDKIWLILDGVNIFCENDAALRVEQADKVFLNLAGDTENTLSSGSEYDEDLISNGVDGTIYSRDDLTVNGTGSLSVTAAYKHGIVANDDLVITGGTITVEAAEDGLHANDSFRFCSADLTVTAGDDGVTVRNDDETAYIYVESGSITVTECYEGLEAAYITIAGGDTDITCSDDGLNANSSDGSSEIHITGGNLVISNPEGRDADGIDSNGNIYIEGGNILISMSDSGGSAALDFGSENGGECIITGGTLIGCGSSQLVETLSDSSTQCSILYSLSETVSGGSAVTLTDAEGNVLIEGTVENDFSCVALSTSEMTEGETYTLICGELSEEITTESVATSNVAGGGMMGGMGGMSMDGGMPDFENGEMPQGAVSGSGDSSDTSGTTTEGTDSTGETSAADSSEEHQAPASSSSSSDGSERHGPPADASSSSDSSERHGPPANASSSSDSGEMSDFENGEKPDFENGERPQGGGPDGDMNGGPGMGGEFADAAEAEASSVDPVTVLIVLILCGGALAGGILFAVKFKGRNI